MIALFGHNLSRAALPVLVKKQAASGTSVVETDVVDLEAHGAEGVLFFGRLATPNPESSVKLQVSADGAAGWVDLADHDGAAVAVTTTAADNLFVLDVYRPPEAFVKAVVDRSAAGTAVGDVFAVPYAAGQLPVEVPAEVDLVFAGSPVKAEAAGG